LIALAFLEKYPTPELGRALTLDDIRQFLREHRYSGRKIDVKAIEMYDELQAPAPTAGVQAGMVLHVQMLIPILRHIYNNRTGLRKRIVQAFPGHPDAAWWQTIPGAKQPDRCTFISLGR
jgi:hypothetical protein